MSTDAFPSWLRRWNIGILLILVLLCAADFLMPFYLFPSFERMYQEIRGGVDLPWFSQEVTSARTALMILACVWLVIGILLTVRKKTAARRWLYVLQVLALLQCAITVAALVRLIVASTGVR